MGKRYGYNPDVVILVDGAELKDHHTVQFCRALIALENAERNLLRVVGKAHDPFDD